MAPRVKARFDGKVFVPEEDVDLEVGTVVELTLVERPHPGSWDAIVGTFRMVQPPQGFDPTRITREEWYD
jgi:hypothetical protein